MVTGSTQGIGKAYSYELAKRGINIVFIAIGMDDLLEVSSDISKLLKFYNYSVLKSTRIV